MSEASREAEAKQTVRYRAPTLGERRGSIIAGDGEKGAVFSRDTTERERPDGGTSKPPGPPPMLGDVEIGTPARFFSSEILAALIGFNFLRCGPCPHTVCQMRSPGAQGECAGALIHIVSESMAGGPNNHDAWVRYVTLHPLDWLAQITFV